MSFVELDIKDYYNTDSDYIPEDFYGLVLPKTEIYKRAAGFFSSSALVTMGAGLKSFYLNGGKMRLLVTPIFSKEDYEAIELGYKAQEDVVSQRLIEAFNLNEIENEEGANILAWLIYEKRLEIRAVVKKSKDKKAIFHDKFSVLIDEDGNRITFRGSMNESGAALVDNFETIEVDCSWEAAGYRRAVQREEQFDSIWDGGANRWNTIALPQAIEDALISIRKPIVGDVQEMEEDLFEPIEYNEKGDTPYIPNWLELRDYQKKAIASWVKNGNCGIFEMATGTGKTKTSLAAITKILEIYYSNDVKCGLIVVVPYVVLLEQWMNDLQEFNISPIPCYESRNKWEKRVESSIDLFNKNVRNKFFLITTNKTFITYAFQNAIRKIKGDYIFCADEMHHLTSDKMRESLPVNVKYKLGLSATLMTKYNSQKMIELKQYFGDIIFQYSMKEAIDNDFLTKYYYYPIYVELTDNEKFEYYELSRKISKAVAANDGMIDEENPGLQALLSQRARILASAENKLVKLREIAKDFKEKSNLIVYCGDKIEADVRYIDRVFDIINNENGIVAAKFTSGENRKQRQDIIEALKKKLIQAVVAIRCLDEGVDIPQLEHAIIMSSGTNPKEFIQRRGRILRKSSGKKFAFIYDFIVIPTLNTTEIEELTQEEKDIEMKIIAREYERVKEFADLAENGMDVMSEFLEKWRSYTGG